MRPTVRSRRLGARLSRYRTERGLSGTALAAELGVGQPQLSRIETGRTKITAATLARLVDVLAIPETDACSLDELPVMLKGQLLTEVLDHGAYELALHAAALFRNEHIVLLCGHPGAGKTTLTLALVHAGFGFVADDVTLLDSRGRGIGLPFAPAVKAGAWPLLAEYCPGLDAVPVCRRPDRRRVRFAVPKAFVPLPPDPLPIGHVVLLRRGRDSKASLEPVDPAHALRGLLNGALAPGGELSGTAFDVLIQLIGSAQTYCLTYSKLDDAVKLITRACR